MTVAAATGATLDGIVLISKPPFFQNEAGTLILRFIYVLGVNPGAGIAITPATTPRTFDYTVQAGETAGDTWNNGLFAAADAEGLTLPSSAYHPAGTAQTTGTDGFETYF